VKRNSNNKKVFVIGLDGATISLVKKWTEENKLPVLAGLMKEGVYGHLKTVPNQNSAPAWTSFMTGKNPGRHGIYYFYEKRHNSYNIRYLNGGDSKSATIWSLLSKSGKKVGVVNVPMTYPAKEVNGFLVSGMDAPGRGSSGFTYPEVLAEELFRIVPDYVIEPGITTFVSRRQYALAIEVAMNSIDARGRATRYLMDKYPWEFFMVVFRESDVIQHHFWKFSQEVEPASDDKDKDKYSDAVFNIYKRLDFEVGKMISTLAEDCYVIVLSDHGGGIAEGGPPYLNYLLRHLGMLEFKEGGDKLKGRIEGVRQRFFEKTISFLQRHTSRKSKEKLLRLFPGFRDRLESERYFSNIDWARTRAFGESNRIELWINLKGREPHGTVLPGREYEDLCEELRMRLYQWYDPITYKRVVKKVFRKEEVYHGEYLDRSPDLLIIFEDDIKVSGIMLVNRNGNREYVDVPQNVSDTLKVNGAHRDNGLFIMKGYGIKRGVELEGAEIVDLAPTILYLMGEGIPSDMDGKVLMNAFEEAMIKDKPLIADNTPRDEIAAFEEEGYGEDERKTIEERLKGLGYIE